MEAIHSRAVAQRVLANRLKLEAELLQGIEDVTPADYQGDVKVYSSQQQHCPAPVPVGGDQPYGDRCSS